MLFTSCFAHAVAQGLCWRGWVHPLSQDAGCRGTSWACFRVPIENRLRGPPRGLFTCLVNCSATRWKVLLASIIHRQVPRLSLACLLLASCTLLAQPKTMSHVTTCLPRQVAIMLSITVTAFSGSRTLRHMLHSAPFRNGRHQSNTRCVQ